MEMLV